MSDFLTVKEVAEIFRLKKDNTVREWIKDGLFPNAINRNGYLIPRRDVDALIAASLVTRECPPPHYPPKPTVQKRTIRRFVTDWKA